MARSLVATMMAAALLTMGAPTFAQKNPDREAFFGETHVHTSWSLDSYLGFGNTIAGPEAFYKYSMGQSITHPGGFTVKITKPLDWGATALGDAELKDLIVGTPLEATVYKLSNKYVAARSNEFGYANYEIETAAQ